MEIYSVSEVEDDSGNLFLVMDWTEGTGLRDAVRFCIRKKYVEDREDNRSNDGGVDEEEDEGHGKCLGGRTYVLTL